MRDAEDAEAALAAFWTTYAATRPNRHGRLRFVLRHPWRTLRAVRDVRTLPVHDARLTDSAGGRAIARILGTPAFLGRPISWYGPAVLEVPADPATYRTGSSRQTLRRKIKSAQKQGVRVRPVRDAGERRALLARADRAERQHPDATYRIERPDNDDLLDHDLWLVAEDPDGEPLLLCVIPTDGAWSVLRYFRTLGSGPAHSDARYLATAVLVDELAARGVRWLVDTEHPGAQTNGLRHFQRMLGFRYARIRIGRTAAAEATTAAA